MQNKKCKMASLHNLNIGSSPARTARIRCPLPLLRGQAASGAGKSESKGPFLSDLLLVSSGLEKFSPNRRYALGEQANAHTMHVKPRAREITAYSVPCTTSVTPVEESEDPETLLFALHAEHSSSGEGKFCAPTQLLDRLNLGLDRGYDGSSSGVCFVMPDEGSERQAGSAMEQRPSAKQFNFTSELLRIDTIKEEY